MSRKRCCWNSLKVAQVSSTAKDTENFRYILLQVKKQLNQPSHYGAVAKTCEEYESLHDRSGQPDVLMGSSQPKGWIQGNTKIGPVLEVTTSSLYCKHGVEIRIWSLIEDNTQSWVRISHGSNKFVIDSNNNNTESPEDLLEEQASQLKVKDFAARSKTKAKPQRRELVDYSPSIIPMNERMWIDFEP